MTSLRSHSIIPIMKKTILTLTALVALSLSASAAAPKDATNPFFKKHDANGDGISTQAEFVKGRSALMVKNKKGTKEECDKTAAKYFKNTDKNKDGKITPKEFFAKKK